MLSLSALAAAIGARLSGVDAQVEHVSTDSRNVGRGALFVALRGERFDGHAFVQAALQGGAAAAMVDEASQLARTLPTAPLIIVDDTKRALAAFARWWRAQYTLPLIAVVGSNGKTTVKEMIAAILREQFGAEHVLATEGNLNNDIGLPLTLLRLRESHRVGVVELGMNHPGETALLAAIAQPTIGLINNAQREHQEFMKSVADVAAEHGALIATLPDYGAAILNADDAFAGYWRGAAGSRPIRDFGLNAHAMVTGRFAPGIASTDVEIVLPEGVATAILHIPGLHNVPNALAAAAAASAAGATPHAIGAGLSAFRPAKGRLQVLQLASGATLVDDTYNANPDSVRAAIDILAGADRPRVLILGDMGEVGAEGPKYHDEVGAYAKARGVDHLLAIGAAARDAVGAFGRGAEHFDEIDALASRARALARGGATVLVKGSRFMRMERVVSALRGQAQGEAACA